MKFETKEICPLCGMQVAINNYSRHLKRHETRPESFKPKREHNSLNCKYCNRLCKNYSGLTFHEDRCHNNPNRIIQSEVIDYKEIYRNKSQESKDRMAWSRGQTALTNDSIRKQAESTIKYYEEHDGTFKGKHHTEKSKALKSKSAKEYRQKFNIKRQSFSKEACDFIDMLNSKFNWNLQHATNGGEVKVLNYHLDGYDKQLNIAFEYDESKYHYKNKYANILSDKDIERQNKIIKELKCRFIRYNPYLDYLYEITNVGNKQITL